MLHCLAVLGWLVVALLALRALRKGQDPMARRLFTAALMLAVLRAMHLLGPDPHMVGALTVAEALIFVWPFITPAIPAQTSSLLVSGALYAVLLLYGAAWRFSRHEAVYVVPIELTTQGTSVFWMALTVGATIVGQILLGRQRLWLLRAALLLLALAALLAMADSTDVATAAASVALLLAFAQYILTARVLSPSSVRAPSSRAATRAPRPAAPSPPEPATAITPPRPATELTPRYVTTQPATSGPPSERYLFERRQLISMRLASLAAYDTPNRPDVLNEMLSTFTAIAPADVAYILLLNERDASHMVLALTSKYDALQSSSAMLPADLDEEQAPELFHALRHNQRMMQGEGEVKVEVESEGDVELRSGPVLVQPITRGDRAYGLVIVGNPHSKRFFSEHDSQLCQVLAVSVGAVFARERNRASVPLVADDYTAMEERGNSTLPALPSAAR